MSRGFMILTRPSGMVLMSAEVPPMSTVMMFLTPAISPSEAPPITPPAGPDIRMRTGRVAQASTVETPPFDCMMRSLDDTPASRSFDSRSRR